MPLLQSLKKVFLLILSRLQVDCKGNSSASDKLLLLPISFWAMTHVHQFTVSNTHTRANSRCCCQPTERKLSNSFSCDQLACYLTPSSPLPFFLLFFCPRKQDKKMFVVDVVLTFITYFLSHFKNLRFFETHLKLFVTSRTQKRLKFEFQIPLFLSYVFFFLSFCNENLTSF